MMDSNNAARINSLNSDIYHKNCRIDDLSDDITVLRRKLASAQETQRKHQNATKYFQDDAYGNAQRAKNVAAIENMKLAPRYASAFSKRISGQKYNSSYDVIDAMGLKLIREIERLEDAIAAKQREISLLQDQISSLRQQVYRLD